MKRPLFALLCIAAGLAGWGGMAWRQEATAPGKPAAAPAPPRPAAAKAPLHSRTAEALQLARSLDTAAEDSRAKLKALPPGAARDLALALFDVRCRTVEKAAGESAAAEPHNPFDDLPPDAKESLPEFEYLKNRMLSGVKPRDPSRDEDAWLSPRPDDPAEVLSSDSLDQISRWASLDPAAASETILKMPATELRTAAVNAAAEVMARTDPKAAWDLVVKSGEKKAGNGFVSALLAIVKAGDTQPAVLTSALTPELRRGLSERLSSYYTGRVDLGQAPAGEELQFAVKAAQALPETEGRRELARLLAAEDRNALLAVSLGGTHDPNAPEESALSTEGYLSMLDPGHPLGTAILEDLGRGAAWDETSPAMLNATAARLLPSMASAGKLTLATELYGRITDAGVRQQTLEKLLPQWMDADPAAARAAFNAAPFTALERERWQQHPAFLLNPAPP